ncbi:uncharacterized protein LOC132276534 [Cornus florida]|uniref:uncharacterized protein LOC132276534 n=1 Tax=Cornus florida TaxID=4283 RepID=UPI0028A1447B|nr:uncharacterized protein LOC132276534 [Cornus florida]
MQRDREGSFGSHGSMMSSIFGGRDPFDDPFFARPFGSLFDSSGPFGANPQISRSNGPLIEELDADDDNKGGEEEGDDIGVGDKKDKARQNTRSNKDPLVEHPDDQVDERKSEIISSRSGYNKVEGTQSQTRSVSFRRVTYGGINGTYYTATNTRRTGSDGVVLEENKQADRTTGQATHRISRGIHDKGHSVTRKLNSDGKVDTTQTLHNLNEGDLDGFEQAWKVNAEKHLPGRNDGFNVRESGGASSSGQAARGGWALPFTEFSERSGRVRPGNSSGVRSKKVVTINIE